MHAVTGIRGSKHVEFVELMEVDDAICAVEVVVEVEVEDAACELEDAVEAEDAIMPGTPFCDVVFGAVVAGPLFVTRYMARPIITMMAMTIAAPSATAMPVRDSSNLISTDIYQMF